jgi:hypothetical protein
MKNLNKQPEPTQTPIVEDYSQYTEKPKNENSSFDFTHTEAPSESLGTYSEQKKAELNDKIFHPKYSQNKSAIWIMALLILSLTGLCGFTTYQIYNYEKTIAANNSKSDLKNATIIAGDTFSFVINKPIPGGFSKESLRVDFEWLEGRKGFVNSFISKEKIDGEDNYNGLSVYSTEYDSKLGQSEFTQSVATKIGDNYRISNERIALPNGVVLTPIIPINSRMKITYYTGVNAANYFVIKSYTQGKDNPKINDKAEFTKELLNNLRIN